MYNILVLAYVVKERRARLMGKQDELLEKLCHNYNSVFIDKYIIHESRPQYSQIEVSHKGQIAFCLSRKDQYNGKWISGCNLMDVDCDFPVVLIYKDGIAQFKTESFPRAKIMFLSRSDVNCIIRTAQQVDSAEASTIAVPPFNPPGSPR